MNVDRRWKRTSVVASRILAAGLILLGAGCAVLGWGFRSSRSLPLPAFASAFNSISGLASKPAATPLDRVSPAQAHSLFAGLPLFFEPNQGQGNLDATDARAKFVSHGAGYSLFLGSEGAILSLVSRNPEASKSFKTRQPDRVDSFEMKFAGANPAAFVTSAGLMRGKSNYFIGNNPAKWRTSVPQFARVRYSNLYPGIDLVFYGDQGQLEYDFQVAPGSDPAQAELEFRGARHLELKDGSLVVHTGGASVQLKAPVIYQEVAGKKQPVTGSFVLRGRNRAGFSVGSYDHSRELIIDPVLLFSTYFGGSGDEHNTSVAVDGAFNIYLTGSTTSPNLPAASTVVQPSLIGNGPNVYVAKIQQPLLSTAPLLEFVTYLGGTGQDYPVGIMVDGAGNPYFAGTTSSPDFPVTDGNAYQTTPESVGTHVFVTKMNNEGTALAYSSYLSGNGTDIASGMTIDPAGNLYVTGTTTSVETLTTDQFPASNLPQSLPYQNASKLPGQAQFFVTKVNTSAPRNGSIIYSTYFGGGTSDTTTPIAVGGGIAVDTSYNVYFTGTTNYLYSGCTGCSTTDFPILDAYQPCLDTAPPAVPVNSPSCSSTTATPNSDAFVAKLNPSANQGEQLIWSTYVGGTGTDSSTGVALDPGAANVYIVGTTNSPDIATGVTTLNTSGSFQACLDQPGIAAGSCATLSNPADDAFVARLSNPGLPTSTTPVNVALNYFSYLGGSADEAGLAITVDTASGALLTGWTQSANFPVLPVASSIQSTLNGTQDAFMARLNTAAIVGQNTSGSWANYFGGSGIDSGTGIALDPNQDTYISGETNSTDLQVAKPLQATNAGGYDAFVTHLQSALSLSLSGTLTLGTNQVFISAGNPATFTYTVTNTGPDLANNVVVSDNINPSFTGIPLTFQIASASSGTCGGSSTGYIVSCTIPSLQSGAIATVTFVLTPNANSTGASPESFNGGTVQAIAPGNIVLAQTSVSAQMSDFSMQVEPNSQSVPAAGDPAFYSVQLTPHPLFGSNVTLSCTNIGQMPGGACNFSPSTTATMQGASGVTATLIITTTARPVTTTSIFQRRFYAFWLAVPGLALLGAGVGGNRRRRRIAGIFLLCLLFSMLIFLPSCSHTNVQAPTSGTPSGTYNITVTGTSGGDSKSQTVTLFVP